MNELKDQLINDCQTAIDTGGYIRINFQNKTTNRLFTANLRDSLITDFTKIVSDYDDTMSKDGLTITDWKIMYDATDYYNKYGSIH